MSITDAETQTFLDQFFDDLKINFSEELTSAYERVKSRQTVEEYKSDKWSGTIDEELMVTLLTDEAKKELESEYKALQGESSKFKTEFTVYLSTLDTNADRQRALHRKYATWKMREDVQVHDSRRRILTNKLTLPIQKFEK
ncbi:uncharacterized protein I206_104582 [Kwoniella pini CBS 10737]|uniref:Uncharacterized protein n=1 Tax=Kwoniella pini CBS 10737 TaxID=1296096 RepID=A0A1B9I794_9TREE|nr:uncharacterized protein I206_02116 [Kwoniella pini CBS 10737]OCF51402.1 hypothetical protein I206_02116 [Kwoniella pini CBS 10737]